MLSVTVPFTIIYKPVVCISARIKFTARAAGQSTIRKPLTLTRLPLEIFSVAILAKLRYAIVARCRLTRRKICVARVQSRLTRLKSPFERLGI